MKKILIAILMMAPLSLCAQKFAHFNSADIIPNMKEYSSAMAELENMQKQYPLGCYKGADITFDAEGNYVSGAIPATANNCVNVGEVKK